MTSSDERSTRAKMPLNRLPTETGPDAVLAREAGVPFQPCSSNDAVSDPFVEWLSLMEVVQMLCPVWPVRDRPVQGTDWRL